MLKNIIIIILLVTNIIFGWLLWNLIDGYNPDCVESKVSTMYLTNTQPPFETQVCINKIKTLTLM